MKRVTIISHTDDFSGVKTITIFGWNGVCYDLPRKRIADLNNEEHEHADKPGVYHLLDENINNIYIGQTDDLKQRISTHNNKEPFEWTRVIAFCSSDLADLNIAHARYLEFHLTQTLKDLDSRINIKSGANKPNKLGKVDKDMALEFYENLKQVMLVLGVNIYQEIEEKESDKIKESVDEVVAHTEEVLDIDENIESDDTECERADIDDTSETNSEFVLVRESPNKTKKYVADLVSTQGYSNVEFIDSVLDKKVFRTKTHFEALLYLEQLLKGNPELDIKIAKISVDSGIVQVVED